MQLSILFEDDYLIAVDKPSGLLVHPSWITKPDEPTLMGLLKEQYNAEKLHTIHRLDRATSGVMLVGKEIESSKRMQEQFQARGVKKEYECIVRGWFDETQGRSEHALGTPFYGSSADRRDVTMHFIDELDKQSGGNIIIPPADWYTMDGETYAKTYMEHGSSFHIAPPFYYRNDWGVTLLGA